MKFKTLITAGMVMTMLFGSTLNVFAAEPAEKLVDALKKNNQANMILDVKAYKAAYSDLAAIYGDDWDAYLEHYLTHGIYEKRTKGALFDPLTYAASYSDVQAAYGDDILKIVNHYVTHGVKENRVEGTAGSYTDLATAEKSGTVKLVPRDSSMKTGSSAGSAKAAGLNKAAASSKTGSKTSTLAIAEDGSVVAGTVQDGKAVINAVGATESAGIGNAAGNNAAASAAVVNNSSASAAPAASNVPAINPALNRPSYDYTTEIYDNDGQTLIRIEYYDNNNHLFQYSDVKDYDSNTHSYTEEVYSYDFDKDEETLERTDVFVNGELTSSQ